MFWDFKLRSLDSSKASTGESKKTIKFKLHWIFWDNPFDTSRMWAWNSAYSTEQILLGHLATKLHRSKARFLTLILRVTDWKTTLIQTLCLFTLSNAKQSRFAPSCYGGVLLEKYFYDLRALKGPCGLTSFNIRWQRTQSVTSLCHINLGWTRPFVTLTQQHLPSLLVYLSGQTGCGWTRTSWIILFSSCEGSSSRLANSVIIYCVNTCRLQLSLINT